MTRKVVLKNGRLPSEVVHGCFDVLYDELVIGKKKKKFRIIYILHSIHRIPSRYPLKKLETSFGRSVVRIKRILIQNKTT